MTYRDPGAAGGWAEQIVQEGASLGTAVAQLLREQIWAGDLTPGQPLREAQLAQVFQVSRGSLREAFQILEYDGLVVNIPRRGVRVRAFTHDEARQIYEARRTLEKAAFEHLIDHQDTVDWQPFETIVADMLAASAHNDWAAVLDGDLAFHQRAVGCMDNPFMEEFWRLIASRVRLLLSQMSGQYGDCGTLVEEHRELLTLLQTGDRAQVRQQVETHLKTAQAWVLAQWDAKGAL